MRDIQAIRQIVEELIKVKKRRRFSIKELAKMFDVRERTIGRWFNKENLPQPVYIPMIKKLIEIDNERIKKL